MAIVKRLIEYVQNNECYVQRGVDTDFSLMSEDEDNDTQEGSETKQLDDEHVGNFIGEANYTLFLLIKKTNKINEFVTQSLRQLIQSLQQHYNQIEPSQHLIGDDLGEEVENLEAAIVTLQSQLRNCKYMYKVNEDNPYNLFLEKIEQSDAAQPSSTSGNFLFQMRQAERQIQRK